MGCGASAPAGVAPESAAPEEAPSSLPAPLAADAPTLGASLPEGARDWDDLEALLRLGEKGAGRESARRRYMLGWDAARDAPSALLDADAAPRDVLAAALAATKAAVDSKRETLSLIHI